MLTGWRSIGTLRFYCRGRTEYMGIHNPTVQKGGAVRQEKVGLLK